MKKSKNLPAFIIGLALFSMFFGSGNLIFPLFLGKIGLDKWTFASLGFVLTAAFLPFAGVLAMVVYKGDYVVFFNCLGKHLGFLVTVILLTTWIPLGSSPRCIALSYASIAAITPSMIPIWAFSLIYCICVFFIVSKKSRILDILGYFFTPLLLSCLAIIIVKGILLTDQLEQSSFSSSAIFYRGLLEGYNTMDLIASFFFSASIIGILKQSSKNSKDAVKLALKSGIIGVSTLAIVYVGLIFLAAGHSLKITEISKEQLLAHLAKILLHPKLSLAAVLAIVIACFTTSVALVVVYSDFLAMSVFRRAKGSQVSIYITLVITFVMSLFGLHGITTVTSPILQVFYPVLIILIAINFIKKSFRCSRN